jgi:hypothetical protein
MSGAGLVKLVGLVFLATAGGPFGMEDTVSSGGAFLTLVTSLVMPFLVRRAAAARRAGDDATGRSGTCPRRS